MSSSDNRPLGPQDELLPRESGGSGDSGVHLQPSEASSRTREKFLPTPDKTIARLTEENRRLRHSLSDAGAESRALMDQNESLAEAYAALAQEMEDLKKKAQDQRFQGDARIPNSKDVADIQCIGRRPTSDRTTTLADIREKVLDLNSAIFEASRTLAASLSFDTVKISDKDAEEYSAKCRSYLGAQMAWALAKQAQEVQKDKDNNINMLLAHIVLQVYFAQYSYGLVESWYQFRTGGPSEALLGHIWWGRASGER